MSRTFQHIDPLFYLSSSPTVYTWDIIQGYRISMEGNGSREPYLSTHRSSFLPLFFPKQKCPPLQNSGHFSACQKASQSLPLKAANQVKSVFGRGVYLGENTYQAASVEFVRPWRTNYARSRLQETCQKSPLGIFDSLRNARRFPTAGISAFFFFPLHISAAFR